MLRIFFLIFIFICRINLGWSQNTGYLGKKTVVDFNFVGNFTILPNLIQKQERFLPRFKNVNGQLVESPDHFDYGGEININRVIKRRFAIGVCIGTDNYSVGLSKNYFVTSVGSFKGGHEQISVNGFYILPTLCFAHKAGTLPMGIVHEIGVGYRSDKPIEKNYLIYYKLGPYDGPNEATFMNSQKLYNFSHKAVFSVPIFYSIKFRYPLNDFIFINSGIRYIASFQNSSLEGHFTSESGYLFSENDMQQSVNSRRRCSIIKGFVGLSLILK